MTARVVVGVPTFRRPDGLRALLLSIDEQVREAGAAVIVADNAPGEPVDAPERAPDVVEERRRAGLPVTYVAVPERGISQARNALVRAAHLHHPEWEWLVMLDDDGTVEAGWFTALLGAAREHAADVVGGPVLGPLPQGASLVARNSVYAGRPRFATGPVGGLNGAQNIAIGRRIADAIGDPWFPPHLGAVGGEDHWFFRRVQAEGGRLVWCDEAVIHEPPPAHRLTTRSIVRRAFHSNVIAAQTERAFAGSGPGARKVVTGTGLLARNAAAGLARRDPDRLARTALDAVSLAGRAVGLARRTPASDRYVD